MTLALPFTDDYKNKEFFYLRKTSSGRYDLFVAVLVDKSHNIEINPDYQATYYDSFGNVVRTNFSIKPVEGGLNNPADRIENLVFRNVIKLSAVTGASQRIRVDSLQFIEFDDADLNDNEYDDVAIGCPYVHVRGMIMSAINHVRPLVIVPINAQIFESTISSPDILSRVCGVHLKSSSLPSGFRWEFAPNIGFYTLEHSEIDGGFEAHVTNEESSGIRKTKVKNRNKTSSGGGPGSGKGIPGFYYRLKNLVRSLFR